MSENMHFKILFFNFVYFDTGYITQAASNSWSSIPQVLYHHTQQQQQQQYFKLNIDGTGPHCGVAWMPASSILNSLSNSFPQNVDGHCVLSTQNLRATVHLEVTLLTFPSYKA